MLLIPSYPLNAYYVQEGWVRMQTGRLILFINPELPVRQFLNFISRNIGDIALTSPDINIFQPYFILCF